MTRVVEPRTWLTPIRSRGGLVAWTLVSSVAASQAVSAEQQSAPAAVTVVQRLPNGLTVVIRRDPLPVGRVEVRLVVRAGTNNETAEQRGATSLVAHVAVQGTPRFPREVLNTYLQTLAPRGVATDTLVQVSATATVYRLSVAADAAALTRGIALLTDWARGVSITPGTLELARHRAAVTRLGDDEPFVVVDSIVDAVRFDGVASAAKPPLESSPDLRTPAQVVHFEHVWYRPDNMALVIVGDIDPRQIVPLVTVPMRSLVAPHVPMPSRSTSMATAAGASAFGSPLGTITTMVTDTQTQGPWIRVLYRLPPLPSGDVAKHHAGLLDPLYGQLLNLRLGAAAGHLHTHIRWAITKFQWDQPGGDLVTVQVRVQTVGAGSPVDSAVAAVVTEVARAGAYGFTSAELALAQQLAHPIFEPSAGQAAQLVHEVVANGLPSDSDGVSQALADVTPQALQARAAQWAHVIPQVVVGVPAGYPMGTVTAASVAQVVVTRRQQPVALMAIDTAVGIDTLLPSPGVTLAVAVQRTIAQAVRTGRTPVLFQTEDGCENCLILERLLRQPQMRGLLQSMEILLYNVDTWQLRRDDQDSGLVYMRYRLPGERMKGFPYLVALARDGAAQSQNLPGASWDDDYFNEAVLATHGAWTTGFVGSTLPQTAVYFALWRTAFQEHTSDDPTR